MNTICVEPLKKVDKIEFGMERDAVRKLYGEYEEFKKSEYSENTTDDFGNFLKDFLTALTASLPTSLRFPLKKSCPLQNIPMILQYLGRMTCPKPLPMPTVRICLSICPKYSGNCQGGSCPLSAIIITTTSVSGLPRPLPTNAAVGAATTS